MTKLKCPHCGSPRVQRNFDDAPILLRAVGINELLCNNCNAEFRGFALPGTIRRSRNRKIEFGGGAGRSERRRAQRYAVRVRANVGLFPAGARHDPAHHAPSVFHEAYTRNLSLFGLALVLPDVRFTDADLRPGGTDSAARRLRVLLQIEPRTLTLDATVVRFEQLDEQDAVTGWLIAARITRLAEPDRERYVHFLKTFGG